MLTRRSKRANATRVVEDVKMKCGYNLLCVNQLDYVKCV